MPDSVPPMRRRLRPRCFRIGAIFVRSGSRSGEFTSNDSSASPTKSAGTRAGSVVVRTVTTLAVAAAGVCDTAVVAEPVAPTPRDDTVHPTSAPAHFVAAGVGDFTLRSLALELGTSHQLLLYHFGSRDGVARAALARIQQAV